MPAAIAVSTPVAASIVPTVVAELAHVPPDGVLPKVRVSPMHTAAVPLIADGKAYTVNTADCAQPVERV